MPGVAIAENGERLYPPFSEEDLQRVVVKKHLPHDPRYCDMCEKRAKEFGDNDLTQIMDRVESVITEELDDSPYTQDIINKIRKEVDGVVHEDLSDMYE